MSHSRLEMTEKEEEGKERGRKKKGAKEKIKAEYERKECVLHIK